MSRITCLIIFSGSSALSIRSLRLARTNVETRSSNAMMDSFFFANCLPERSYWFAKRSGHGVEGSLLPQLDAAPQGSPTTALCSNNLALQLPGSSFMLLMDHGALGTYLLSPPERRPYRHSNRNSDAQPDRDVSGQNPGDRSQRRSQRNAQSCVFRFARHLLAPETCCQQKR